MTSINYSILGHITLAEGHPYPMLHTKPIFMANIIKVVQTIQPFIFLVSIRKGYKVFHHYVTMERVNQLLGTEMDDCE
jgi:hypothetical protein